MVIKVATSHEVSGINNPVTHGTARFDLTKTSLSAAANALSVLKLSDVPSGVAVIIEDAWIEVTSAFDANTKFGLGDGTFDNNFLALLDVSSTGVKGKDASDKGVALSDNRTAFVDSSLNLIISTSTAIPQQVATGSAVLYVAYKEVEDASHTESDIGDVVTSVGEGTVPSSGSEYTFTASDGTNSADINDGDTLQITGSGVAFNSATKVFTITGSAGGGGSSVDPNYWGAIYSDPVFEVNATGTITAIKSGHVEMGELDSTNNDPGYLHFTTSNVTNNDIPDWSSAYNDVSLPNSYIRATNTIKITDNLRPGAELPDGANSISPAPNPFFPTYVVTVATGYENQSTKPMPTVILPDPNDYAVGCSLRVYYPVDFQPNNFWGWETVWGSPSVGNQDKQSVRQNTYRRFENTNQTNFQTGGILRTKRSGDQWVSLFALNGKGSNSQHVFNRRLIKVAVDFSTSLPSVSATGNGNSSNLWSDGSEPASYTNGILTDLLDKNGTFIYKQEGGNIYADPSAVRTQRSMFINGDFNNYGSRIDITPSGFTQSYGGLLAYCSHYYMAPGDIVTFTRSPAMVPYHRLTSDPYPSGAVWQITNRVSSYPDYSVNDAVPKFEYGEDTMFDMGHFGT